jgi:hypothetical protein
VVPCHWQNQRLGGPFSLANDTPSVGAPRPGSAAERLFGRDATTNSKPTTQSCVCRKEGKSEKGKGNGKEQICLDGVRRITITRSPAVGQVPQPEADADDPRPARASTEGAKAARKPCSQIAVEAVKSSARVSVPARLSHPGVTSPLLKATHEHPLSVGARHQLKGQVAVKGLPLRAAGCFASGAQFACTEIVSVPWPQHDLGLLPAQGNDGVVAGNTLQRRAVPLPSGDGAVFAKVAQGLPRAPGPLTSMPGSTTVRRPSLFVPPLGRSRWRCLGPRWASMTDARPPASCWEQHGHAPTYSIGLFCPDN